MKPLSPKTLAKMYAGLGLPQESIDLLHVYFLSFSNLYGVISVRDAWAVYRNYEGTLPVHKKDFYAFSGIVRREPELPYAVPELKEVYSGEETDDPGERLIVNGKLIMSGYYKYSMLYNVVDMQGNKPVYLPPDSLSLLAHAEDRFFLSEAGVRMVRFLKGLETSGHCVGPDGEDEGELTDVDGNPTAGKRLSDFVVYTRAEQFDIEDEKTEEKKEMLRQKFKRTALEKTLNDIFRDLQITSCMPSTGPADLLRMRIDFLKRELGVDLTVAQAGQFMNLYFSLNNQSHLWSNRGWRPDELGDRGSYGFPGTFFAGPNMKRMGPDRAEFKK